MEAGGGEELTIRTAVWNVQWKPRNSPAGKELCHRILAQRPQIICLTEAYENFAAETGYAISSGPDYGYQALPGRRKVLLWSPSPWSSIEQLGSPKLPSGRFVSGITQTSIGPLCVIGVCIPWRSAHVTTGQRNRRPWEDHKAYLEGLKEVIELLDDTPTIVVGDFNLRIPRRQAPIDVYARMEDAFGERFEIATRGLSFNGSASIDHIAINQRLRCVEVNTLNNIANDGTKLSDHFGVTATVTLAQT